MQKALSELPEEEAALTRAETLLRALGVKSEEKMRSLVSYFFKDSPQGGLATELMDREDLPGELRLLFKSPDDENELTQIIRPEDVIAAVRAFVDDAADGPQVLGGTSTVPANVEEARRGGRRRLQTLQNYWNQLSQVVGDEAVGVWKQLEQDLQVYKQILHHRVDRIAEVDALSKKNAELKRLLNQYLGARSNDFLQVPPAQTMRLRPVAESSSATAKGKSLKTKKILMSRTG